MTGLTIDTIVNDGRLWGTLGQRRLADLLDDRVGEESRFEADLGVPRVSFTTGRGSVEFRPHLIASVAQGLGTARWAWALPQLSEQPVSALSGRLREFGNRSAVAAMAQPEVPFAAFGSDSRELDPQAVAHRIGILACQVFGEVPYYTAEVGGGTWAVMLLEGGPGLPDATLPMLNTVLMATLESGTLTDHVRALEHLLQRTPWRADWAPQGVRVSDGPDQHLEISIDSQRRITGVRAQFSA